MFDFLRRRPNTGLILDPIGAIAALPKHEDFFGSGARKPWREHMPRFRNQGSSFWCTAFAGTSISSAFESAENGKPIDFSPRELFYRSNGQLLGNSLSAVARAMAEAVVTEEAVPTPIPDRWGVDEWQRHSAGASVPSLDPFRRFRVKSSASVNTDNASLRSALSVSPVYAAIGIGRGYFSKVAPKPASVSDWHAVVVTDVLEDGTKVVFDSLPYFGATDGFHALAPDYPVAYGMTFIDVTEPKEPPKAADPFYGKRRDLRLEQEVAAALAKAVGKRPQVRGTAGRNWFTYVNAVAYGSFTVDDVLNDMVKRARDGRGIFDFRVPRFRQAKWW